MLLHLRQVASLPCRDGPHGHIAHLARDKLKCFQMPEGADGTDCMPADELIGLSALLAAILRRRWP